jgi:hypothetical protein
LRKEAGQPLCAKSTFQLFRAHLVLHPAVQTIVEASLQEAKRTGLLKGQALSLALDTKPIRRRGAVQDTFNLLATGITQLARALARQAKQKTDAFLSEQDLQRYTQSSVKGSAALDGADEAAKNDLLTQIVGDAKRLLALAVSTQPKVRQAASLLEQLLVQDVEVVQTNAGKEQASIQASIQEGTVKGCLPSATDPEMRHGRKSASKRFNGHKADVGVDQDSQIIVAFAVLAGDAGDASGALALVEQAETNTDLTVQETTGDCAYGGGPTRLAFAEAERELLAKVPQEASRHGLFTKSAFARDLQHDRVTCPAGKSTTTLHTSSEGTTTFTFGSVCADCPLRSACTTSKSGRRAGAASRFIRRRRSCKQRVPTRSRPKGRRVCENAWSSSTVWRVWVN